MILKKKIVMKKCHEKMTGKAIDSYDEFVIMEDE